MKQLKKEKWVDDTLESLQGVQRAQAPADLFEKAMQREAYGRAKIVRMAPAQVWTAAACVAVLVIANLFTCLDFAQFSHKAPSAKEMFAKEYFGATDAPQF